MKQVSPELQAAVTASHGTLVELWTFHFASGVKRWTSQTSNIVYDGTTWVTGEAVLGKGRIIANIGTDPVSLTVKVDGAVTIGGASIHAAACGTTFRGIRVQLDRLVVDAQNIAHGLLPVFDGTVAEVRPSTESVELVIKGAMARAQRGGLGTRRIETACPLVVYSPECGAAAQQANVTVAAGSTTAKVFLTSVPSVAVVGSQVTFTSGVLNGVRAIIREVGSNFVVLDRPIASAPVAGVTAAILRGCDKRFETCRAVFNNGARYAGCPFQPAKSLTNG